MLLDSCEPLARHVQNQQNIRVSELLQRAEAEILDRQLVSRGQKILVAVSGGVDSMILLRILVSLAKKHRWNISVAHFNHQLRGRASDADEKCVRQTAAKLRLKFFAGQADVKTFAAQSKISVEMAARKLRHEFLAKIACKQKISTIALAHHADDQVELFFLRLLRGAGGEGLAGMKWRSPSPADRRVEIIRPLLGVAKAGLLAFARAHKIRFCEDASNASSDFLRNRIRNELLPLLRKKYQPAVDKAVLRLMDIAGEESDFVAQAVEAFNVNRTGLAKEVARNRAGSANSNVASFEAQPIAIQRRVLQDALLAAGVPVDFELVESLRSASDIFISIGPDLAVARDHSGCIRIRKTTTFNYNKTMARLNLAGRAGRRLFGGLKIYWKVQPFKRFMLPSKSVGTEFFDADQVGTEIVLRHWLPGDCFQPIGLKSATKLQDLFVNAKIPAFRRRELVLAATSAGQIFWVEGLRIGEKFKLTPQTRARLAWEWSKIAR